jgi:uncharacterized protein (UPF0303 family)
MRKELFVYQRKRKIITSFVNSSYTRLKKSQEPSKLKSKKEIDCSIVIIAKNISVWHVKANTMAA